MFLSKVVLTDAGDGLAAAAILEFSGALIRHVTGFASSLAVEDARGFSWRIAGSQAASVT